MSVIISLNAYRRKIGLPEYHGELQDTCSTEASKGGLKADELQKVESATGFPCVTDKAKT